MYSKYIFILTTVSNVHNFWFPKSCIIIFNIHIIVQHCCLYQKLVKIRFESYYIHWIAIWHNFGVENSSPNYGHSITIINQGTCKTNNKHAYRYKALYYYIDVYRWVPRYLWRYNQNVYITRVHINAEYAYFVQYVRLIHTIVACEIL